MLSPWTGPEPNARTICNGFAGSAVFAGITLADADGGTAQFPVGLDRRSAFKNAIIAVRDGIAVFDGGE